MKIDGRLVLKMEYEYVPIKEFIRRYHPNITQPAISYCIKKGKIDWMELNGKKYVVLTPHTLRYNPIDNYKRDMI